MKLDEEEKALVESYEREEWRSSRDTEQDRRRFRESATATFRKNKRVNIRISEKDLLNIQKRAIREGLPYQTLMASVLHKFISGHFTEKTS